MSLFNKVAIIGVGLIGGSIGCAIKKKKLAKEVIGFGRHSRKLVFAKRIGAIDRGTLKLKDAVSSADLIILATPVSLIPKYIKGSLKFSKPTAIFTDVGSTKGELLQSIERGMPRVRFIGAHPLAGSHNSGAAYSCGELFKGTICVLIKTKRTDERAFTLVKRLWAALGARVVVLTPAVHDKVVAQISHLPHLVAAALVSTPNEEALEFAAAGFRDTTRIASGDPLMWRDVCLTNKDEITFAIDAFLNNLNKLRGLVRRKNSKDLLKEFQRIKKVRDDHCH